MFYNTSHVFLASTGYNSYICVKFDLMVSINKDIIDQAWENRALLQNSDVQDEINKTIEYLDKGLIRVAEPSDKGWIVNQWIKKAVILYFPIRKWKPWRSVLLSFMIRSH